MEKWKICGISLGVGFQASTLPQSSACCSSTGRRALGPGWDPVPWLVPGKGTGTRMSPCAMAGARAGAREPQPDVLQAQGRKGDPGAVRTCKKHHKPRASTAGSTGRLQPHRGEKREGSQQRLQSGGKCVLEQGPQSRSAALPAWPGGGSSSQGGAGAQHRYPESPQGLCRAHRALGWEMGSFPGTWSTAWSNLWEGLGCPDPTESILCSAAQPKARQGGGAMH